MNSRQRRGVILLIVSVLCALAAFAGVLALIRDVESKVGPEKTAYELKDDVPAYRSLSGDQFDKVSDARALAARHRRHRPRRSARQGRHQQAAQGLAAPGGHDVRAPRTRVRASRRSPS